ncbi:hypothetical protein GCM10009718_30800 [Isoptericola halotolerans]|uniref:Sulfotransferase family protein n=1 Tax=Isoptericola halotolerans TaxID=300560 RepID=A0ABX2A3Z3_9MICO|nr:sulfotransferase family 2 domain-containing protein [Isoptericola halotolerans]NOV97582.1 hypothetical protein [Isoptericola halotolerans]
MPIFTKDGRGVLFIHVPKTGGSSIEKHFVGAGWKMSYHDGRIGKGTVNDYRRTTPQHMHAAMLRQNFRLGRFDAVFMVVREPVARFRSEYAWRNGSEMRPGAAEVDTSADAVDAWADKVLDRYGRNPYVLGNHLRPQVEFHVDRAKVFWFEDGLDRAITVLNQDYDLGLPSGIGRARTSEKASGVPSGDVEVSRRLERRLKKFYAKDYETFSY